MRLLLILAAALLAAQTSIGPTSGLLIPIWDTTQGRYFYMTVADFAARMPQHNGLSLADNKLIPTGEISVSYCPIHPNEVGLFVDRNWVVTRAVDERLVAPGGACEGAIEVLNATGLYKCWQGRWVRIAVQQ